MKKLIVIAIIFLASLQIVYSQSGWVIQSSGYFTSLWDSYFIDADTGYAVGVSTVLKTTNGGENWVFLNHGTYFLLWCVQFTNSSTGFAGGQYLIKTTNSGLNWQTHNTNGLIINSMFFLNSDIGWIGSYQGQIIKTTNSGENWTNYDINGASNINDIYFIDSNKGWCVCYNGNIYGTIDGGVNWDLQDSTDSELYAIKFVNENIGWVAGEKILKTTNGGINWFLQSYGYIYQLKDIYFVNSLTGYCVGQYGTIIKTTNGGINWISQISGVTDLLNSIQFVDMNTGWVVGYSYGFYGTILKTTDGGTGSYHDFSSGPFIDFPEVFIKDSSYHIKAKITNEGREPEANVPIRFLINGTQVGYYLRSLPAGGIDTVDFTWTPNTVGDFNVAIASALSTDINRSNDTVKTDVRVYSSSALLIFCDDFSGGTSNWTITNDGGTCVWQAYSPPYPNAYSLPATSSGAVLSADADDCGSGTTLLSTATIIENVDCSLFEHVYLEFDNDWNAIDDQDSAIVEVSYDGGTSWSSVISWGGTDVRSTQESYTIPGADANPNVRIRFRTIQPGWDWWWAIDNVCLKGFPVTGLIQNSKIPTEYALMQNYPNPFNPTTKIKFDLPKSTQAKLIIYDILGREITTLVNEKLSAGSYEVEWSAGSYPSGVYFYKLITKDFSQTKRMVLIK